MTPRRHFLITSACVAAPLARSMPALARGRGSHAKAATAITQVFGDGIRLTAIAVEYRAAVKAVDISKGEIRVEGRTVTDVFVSTSADPKDRAPIGWFVIVNLSTDDANAGLAEKARGRAGSTAPAEAAAAGASGPVGPGRGPGNAGDIPSYDTVYRKAKAVVATPGAGVLATTQVKNLIVDDFQQLVYRHPHTGKRLRYNLFVPKNYEPRHSYPLVLFMHDAGATSDVTRTTLFQGQGATAWASPGDQAKRPCFVLAPQYVEVIADDASRTSDALDATIDLINELANRYSIDRNRLYTTGQSGGCMMSIAMNIKYPEFFAASFLVAGQWNPALVAPLARQKLWILVAQDDDKAFPGQNAITAVLENAGTKVSRAVWDGTWTPDQFRASFEKIDVEGSPVNYVAFRKGTVAPPGQLLSGSSGHRNTWRIAYTIEPIREWIFRQRQ